MSLDPRLKRDRTGRWTVKVSLPSGRYELSLNDRAVTVVLDELDRDQGDAVPEPFVPIFVATGDAWFPNEKDTSSIIDSMIVSDEFENGEVEVLERYLQKPLRPARKQFVEDVLSRMEFPVDIELEERSLPPIPDFVDIDSEASKAENGDSGRKPISRVPREWKASDEDAPSETLLDDVRAVNGTVRVFQSFEGPISANHRLEAVGDGWEIERWYFFDEFELREAKRFGVRLLNDVDFREHVLSY